MTSEQSTFHKTACILCESNCGIEVRLDGRTFERIRGNKDHVGSKGYTCEKALRLDYYQNSRDRLTLPMRRRADGTHEQVSWETAIAEVAARLAAVRDTHGGASIFRYGTGGQGNHLGGVYGDALSNALGVRYRSNALAQEKTGQAYVEGRLYRGHTRGDWEHTEVAVFLGKNPWMSHGLPEARRVLKEIANDPERSMVVIDPRRTKTAELADYFLQVKPGTDAYCVAAIVAVLVRDELVDATFLDAHVVDLEPVLDAIGRVPLTEFAERCGIALADIEAVAHRIGRSDSVSIFEDIGVEQAPNSTLVSYLQRLIWILRGSFAKQGGMNIVTSLFPSGKRPAGERRPHHTPVTGAEIITGLIPCNSIADEILTDHPDRFRAMIIESSNPVHSLAGSARFREAMEALEFSVVFDVVMTETGRLADYVLPSSSQFEKPEAVFFNFEFPNNVFSLRKPVLEPPADAIAEPEIHTRLIEALGLLDHGDVAPLRAAAEDGRSEFAAAFATTISNKPELAKVGAALLYRTLGPTLPDGLAGAAALWFPMQMCAAAYPAAVERAGIRPGPTGLGDALFDAVLASDDGVVFTSHLYEESWDLIGLDDGKIHATIPVLIDELDALRTAPTSYTTPDFPYVLSAGERRSFSANTIIRNPSWRKKDTDGALAISTHDAEQLGVEDGDRIRLTTPTGSAEPTVMVDDAMQEGHISLPNGYGLTYPDDRGEHRVVGVAPNELTSVGWKDNIAGTPWHKHVPAHLERIR